MQIWLHTCFWGRILWSVLVIRPSHGLHRWITVLSIVWPAYLCRSSFYYYLDYQLHPQEGWADFRWEDWGGATMPDWLEDIPDGIEGTLQWIWNSDLIHARCTLVRKLFILGVRKRRLAMQLRVVPVPLDMTCRWSDHQLIAVSYNKIKKWVIVY